METRIDLSNLKNITEFDISGKKILLRVDINSNIDSETGKLNGEAPRIKAIVPTLNSLKDAAVVILAHQVTIWGHRLCFLKSTL